MVDVGFGGSASGGSYSAGLIYSDGIGLPTGRAMYNGSTSVAIVALFAYVAGRSGNPVGSIQLGSSLTGDFACPSAGDSTSGTGWFGSSSWLVQGGSARFQWNGPASGPVWFGKGGGGTTFIPGGSRAGTLGGAYRYVQAPSEPVSVSVAPGVGQATVYWAAPATDGETGINGYYLEYATNAAFTGASALNVGVVTSATLTGLTPGSTYWFRVCAKNGVTDMASTVGTPSAAVSALIGTFPGAPTSPAAAGTSGGIVVSWAPPASDGGAPILDYTLRYSTDSTMTTYSTLVLPASARSKTLIFNAAISTYYAQIVARNAVGPGAATATVSNTPPSRGTLDSVRGAAVDVDGNQIEIRSDAGTGASPVFTLGYTAFGTGSAFVPIATLPTGNAAGQFFTPGGQRNLSLVSDLGGTIFVVGVDSGTGGILVSRYARTGPTAWSAGGVLSQVLSNTGDPIVAVDGVFASGSGGTPTPTILVIARRAGSLGAGNISFATLNLTALAASSGTLFLTQGNDPSWLSSPPAAAASNSGVLDITSLPTALNRVAILANGFSVIDILNGVITLVSKSADGTSTASAWARIIGVSGSSFVILSVAAGALSWTFYSSSGSVLGTNSLPGSSAFGGAFGAQWDAYVDRVANVLRVYYVDATAGAQTLKSVVVSPVSYSAAAAVTLTAALGAATSTNGPIRLPQGVVDERRVLVSASNVLGAARSTALYVDTSANVAPTTPTPTTTPTTVDATQSNVLGWTFTDPDPLDTQSTYELEVQRVSDSVNVVATGVVTSANNTYTLAANTLVNAVDYRWRVRTSDALAMVGAWSPYVAFTTSAFGTLTITAPATDNQAGIASSSVALNWTYTQPAGYIQTSRRVRVIQTSNSAVLSDTTMQVSAATTITLAGLATDVEVRAEVSVVNNGPGTPTIVSSRLITVSYGTPLAPTLSLIVGASYIDVVVGNPSPVGTSRPEVIRNEIFKRATGSTTGFVRIGSTVYGGTYRDRAIKSGISYDYQVKGASV